MMQRHFQSTQLERIIETNLDEKDCSFFTKLQELDRDFQPEGYKTKIKEGRLKDQAKNP